MTPGQGLLISLLQHLQGKRKRQGKRERQREKEGGRKGEGDKKREGTGEKIVRDGRGLVEEEEYDKR